MKSVFVITMWSGGRPAKKWKSEKQPELLPQGTGVSFTCLETRLPVQIIGSISVEEYESGKEEIQGGFFHTSNAQQEDESTLFPEPTNIQRIF